MPGKASPSKGYTPRPKKKPTNHEVNVGLGFSATPKDMDKAVYNYFKQRGYSEQSAYLSKGKSPSAGTRSASKKDPVWHKTDTLRSKLTGQKSALISPQVRDDGRRAGVVKANAAKAKIAKTRAALKNAKKRTY